MQKVMTCLGFDDQAEEAVKFYTSTIRNSKILSTTRYGDAGPGPKGQLLATAFLLDGQEFVALNGGPPFKFSIGMSIVIRCETQADIDSLWESFPRGEKKYSAAAHGQVRRVLADRPFSSRRVAE